MPTLKKFLLALSALACVAVHALAVADATGPADPVALTFLAADPGVDSVLGRQEPFYVWFEVKSPDAAEVSLHPYYRGEPVIADLVTSDAVRLPPGGGNAVAQFFFWGEHTTPVDELRLVVRTGPSAAGQTFSQAVHLQWTADDAHARELAPWVRDWQKSEAERAHGAGPAGDAGRLGAANTVFGAVFVAVMIAIALTGLGLPLWGIVRWRGRWRTLATVLFALPLLDMGWIVLQKYLFPATHPLFQLALFLAFSALAMVISLSVRAVHRIRASSA